MCVCVKQKKCNNCAKMRSNTCTVSSPTQKHHDVFGVLSTPRYKGHTTNAYTIHKMWTSVSRGGQAGEGGR